MESIVDDVCNIIKTNGGKIERLQAKNNISNRKARYSEFDQAYKKTNQKMVKINFCCSQIVVLVERTTTNNERYIERCIRLKYQELLTWCC